MFIIDAALVLKVIFDSHK